MGILIREADLDRELGLLVDTVNTNFGSQVSAERFRWLYLDNPDGRAVAWFAIDDRSGDIVGSTVVSPRRVRLARSRSEVKAWNCGDFSISPRYRTMGAAVKLRRAAREAIDAGQSPFLYAHPNDRMLQVHLMVGHSPLGRMVRYAKLLRARTGVSFVDRAVSPVLRFAGLDCLVRSRHEVEPAGNPAITDELTELYERMADRLGTAIVRDATYLDWRFRRNPAEAVEMLVARRTGRLTGYLVYAIKDRIASIRDWVADGGEAWSALFAAMIRRMRQQDIESISVVALETHPDLPRFRRFGFVRRPESSTAVTYAPDGSPVRLEVMAPRAWYMTVGDRDV